MKILTNIALATCVGLSLGWMSSCSIYAGSADGRIWYSIDDGESFRETPMPAGAGGPVERIFVDPVEPRVALAALGGSGAHVLRTTQYGNFWDVLDGNLPDTPAYAVTADRTAGAIYVATAKGVFFGRADLENASTPSVSWAEVTANLPSAAATDVRLDPTGVQLYVALDGYGVYAAAAPHRLGSLRLVNGGDFSARPAAPGSLVGVVGGHVDSATASGLAYPVLSTSDSQSQLQVPFDAEGPSVSLALRTAAGTVTRDLAILPVSPTIMVGQDGAAMLWDADTGLPTDSLADRPLGQGGLVYRQPRGSCQLSGLALFGTKRLSVPGREEPQAHPSPNKFSNGHFLFSWSTITEPRNHIPVHKLHEGNRLNQPSTRCIPPSSFP